MSSGGGKNSTTTTTNDPPAWAIPAYQQGIGMAMNAANKPYQAYGGQLVAGMNGDQQAAMQMTRQSAGDGSTLSAGNQYAQQLLGGQGQFQQQANPYMGETTNVGVNAYAGANPYLDNMITSSNANIADAYSSTELPALMGSFNSSGAYGGTAMGDAMARSQQGLAGALAQNTSNLRFQDYTTQQGLAESALNRNLGAQQADLSRNASLAEGYLGRDQSAWDSYQGRQLQAMGQAPGLNEANFYGSQQLYNMGQQGQLNNQSALDAQYQQWLGGQNWDTDRLQALSGMLAGIQGGTVNQSGANPNYRSAGQNATTAAAMLAAIYQNGG